MNAAVTADSHELALFEHAQQLGLGRRCHLADLVQKQRTAVCDLELAAYSRVCTGEGPLLVSEQLGFDESRGDCRAVQCHEGLLAARRIEVDGTSYQLLAHAAFAEDQHRGAHGCDALQPVGQPAHRRRLGLGIDGARPLGDLVLEEVDARIELVTLQDPAQARFQFAWIGRPKQIVVDAEPEHAYRPLDPVDGTKKQKRCRSGPPLEVTDTCRGVDFDDLECHEDRIVFSRLGQLQGLQSVGAGSDLVASVGENLQGALPR